MMMKRTTEQITDVPRGNTADQFLLKLGTLKTVDNAHNTACDATRSREHCSCVQGQTRQHSTLTNLPKKQICLYLREQDGSHKMTN